MNKGMNEAEKLVRDLEKLAESLRDQWSDLGRFRVSIDERARIKKHLEWCQNEMVSLLDRL